MSKKSLKLDKEIYNEEVIRQAIEDFKNIAFITYKNFEIIVEWEWDLEEILNEFMNYCLGLQNESI